MMVSHSVRTARANAILDVLKDGPMYSIDIRRNATVPMTVGEFSPIIKYLENLGRVEKCGRSKSSYGSFCWRLVW